MRDIIRITIMMVLFMSAILVYGLFNISILKEIISFILYCGFLYLLFKPLIDLEKGRYE